MGDFLSPAAAAMVLRKVSSASVRRGCVHTSFGRTLEAGVESMAAVGQSASVMVHSGVNIAI
jgi:hypothetical protein